MEQNVSRVRHILLALLAIIFLIGIDQITKYLAVLKLKDQEPLVIIRNVFELLYLENQGAAFGLLQGKKVLFLTLTTAFLIFIVYIYFRMINIRKFQSLRILIVFLTAGAIGNMIDRIWHNYVIDFFYFSLIDFPVFNVADIYVTLSCIIFLILFLFYYKEEDFEQIFPKKGKKR